MRNSTVRAITDIVHRTMLRCHERLVEHDLDGVVPLLNMHNDPNLPTCVYQPRTNAIAISTPQILKITVPEAVQYVLDAMAMCACQRAYQAEMRTWNQSQNKVRMREPSLYLVGTPKWRELRAMLD